MITMISAFISLLSFRFFSRADLELELVALRHQVAVLRRQRKGRLRLFSTDRLLWVWLYRIWPQALNAMVLVKPATVIQWHRKGFLHLYFHSFRDVVSWAITNGFKWYRSGPRIVKKLIRHSWLFG